MTLLNLTLDEVKNHIEVKKESTIIYKKIPCDLLTPVSSLLKIKENYPDYHFLFESVEKGNNRSRFSIIGVLPDLIWKCKDKVAYINDDYQNNPDNFKKDSTAPLESLRNLINSSQITQDPDLPTLASGVFGYMSYDMVRLMEDLPDNNLKDDINIDDSIFIRPQIIIIFDSLFDVVTICSPIYYKEEIDTALQYKNTEDTIDKIITVISQTSNLHKKAEQKELNFISNFTQNEYCQAVKKSQEYIKDGDIFQTLPSQRFTADFDQTNSFAFYRSLRSINPSPFLFYLQFPDFCFTGSSPEIMVSCKDKKVTIRPLAGTRKRGKNEAEDKKIAKELLADKKEVAEHLMLIDLGRHDVGKVCKDHTVELTEKMIVEYYSHVMHISSNVEGTLKDNLDSLDALISGFPAGTVSGAPKIRAMEIIEELESDKRGFYAGCVGYFSSNGDMETCISLRCALIKDNKIHLQAGAGVVFDSDPESEYKECLNKAGALMQAAEEIYKY